MSNTPMDTMTIKASIKLRLGKLKDKYKLTYNELLTKMMDIMEAFEK